MVRYPVDQPISSIHLCIKGEGFLCWFSLQCLFFYLLSNFFNSNIQLYIHVSKLLERKKRWKKNWAIFFDIESMDWKLPYWIILFILSIKFCLILHIFDIIDFVFLCFAVCATDCWDHYGGGGHNPICLHPTDPDPNSVVHHQEIPYHHLKAYQKTGGNQ